MITAPCPPMHRIGVTGAGGSHAVADESILSREARMTDAVPARRPQ